jgi:hypothetical protein
MEGARRFFSGGEGDEGVGIGVGAVEVSSGSVEMMEPDVPLGATMGA